MLIASHLLEHACSGFKEATQSLNGPLERDVEASAANCWELRERSVQVKKINPTMNGHFKRVSSDS